MRRVIFWFDSLNDWQRLQYAVVAILFLLACGGYLLGLGSTIVLARVESEQATLDAEALPTDEPTPLPTPVPVVPTESPTATARPSPTPLPPTPVPTHTPFSAPVISEPPAAPRQLPAVIVPAAPAAPVAPRATPTSARPRIVETEAPESQSTGLRTPTAAARTDRTVLPTPIRQAVATARAVTGTALPTLAVPATSAPKPAAATPAPTKPPAAPIPLTPGKTPASR
jgi:hypothetical protein